MFKEKELIEGLFDLSVTHVLEGYSPKIGEKECDYIFDFSPVSIVFVYNEISKDLDMASLSGMQLEEWLKLYLKELSVKILSQEYGYQPILNGVLCKESLEISESSIDFVYREFLNFLNLKE